MGNIITSRIWERTMDNPKTTLNTRSINQKRTLQTSKTRIHFKI